MTGRSLLILLCAVLAASGCNRTETRAHAPAVEKLLTGAPPPWVERSALGTRLWAVERKFYEARGHLPAWIEEGAATSRMTALVQQLRAAEAHGLDPSTYSIAEIDRAVEGASTRFMGTRFDDAQVPELDARLTYAYLRFAADLLGWARTPRDVTPNWLAAPRKDDLVKRLSDAVADGGVVQSLETLAPVHPQYKGLQAALARTQDDTERQRIRINLERWRWAPRDLGPRHILVNVPAYQMQVIEGDEPVLAMRVIVGKRETPTPLFSDRMTYVVFSPYWNIPESILREETLPRLAEDPEYLVRNNIEVVSGQDVVDPASIDWSDEAVTSALRFRQAPGPENALGLVKFIFPNNFSVYLHDTPTEALFNRPTRTYSHGCVRVERPVALAEYVLKGTGGWGRERIVNAMHAKEERTATLKEPLPVHIGYWTAWVNADGTVTFTDDPYHLDRAHAKLLAPAARRGSSKAD